jgi:hypothetical protein
MSANNAFYWRAATVRQPAMIAELITSRGDDRSGRTNDRGGDASDRDWPRAERLLWSEYGG